MSVRARSTTLQIMQYAVCFVICSGISSLTAQERTITGVVRDSAGRPLVDVRVAQSGGLATTTTKTDGLFVIRVLPPASLVFQLIGFATARVEVGPGEGTRENPLIVVMVGQAAELLSVTVHGERGVVSAESITRESVRHAPALVEPDLFRILPFLPAVLQPNDLTAMVHLAGAATDETSIAVDHHPLQFPTHLGGVFGAFNVAALERADILIHHVPATLDARVGGVIDMRTRRIPSRPLREFVVSLLSSSATIAQPNVFRGIHVLATGRITYMDRLLAALSDTARFGGDELFAPSYRDGLLRIESRLPDGWRGEFLAYGTNDTPVSPARRDGPAPYEWGEALLGATLRRELGTSALRLTLSRNHAYTDDRTAVNGGPPLHNSQLWTKAAATWSMERHRITASTQIEVQERDHVHEWHSPVRFMNARVVAPFEQQKKQRRLSAAGELTYPLPAELLLSVGSRVDVVDQRAYVAPRFAVAWKQSFASFAVASDRRFQFDTDFGPPQPGGLPQPVLLLDRPRRADMISASMDLIPARIGPINATGKLTVFAREFVDRPIPGAAWSRVNGADSLDFARERGTTTGVALSSSLWSDGGFVLQVAYTAQRARQTAAGVWYRAPWDVPQIFTTYASVPLFRTLHVMAAFQAHGGLPVTPVELVLPTSSTLTSTTVSQRLIYGVPYSARFPGFRRWDIGLRRTWKAWGAEWAGTFQIVNLIKRTNVRAIDWHQYFILGANREAIQYASDQGMPRIPSVGLEVHW